MAQPGPQSSNVVGAPTVTDVVRRFSPAYMKAYGKRMPIAHRRAIDAILLCRTPAAGGEVVRCDRCGGSGWVFRSCRHRACTKCDRSKGEVWLQARREELLPVGYFHMVFTVPEGLRRAIRKHQAELYPALMEAVAETLKEIGSDPSHVGGQIGIMSVLHTWTRTLEYHPHVHCLVPAGYLDGDGRWHEVKRPWFAPHQVLAKVFRGKLLAKMRAAVSGLRLPGTVFHMRWVVHVDLPLHGRDVVLGYLARYVHRGPVSDSRIISINQKTVTFKYRSRDRTAWQTMTLKGIEFLRRYLQHVTPSGCHRIRYYGLWSKALRPKLKALQSELLSALGGSPPAPVAPPSPAEHKCPLCSQGRLVSVRFFRRGEEPPCILGVALTQLPRHSPRVPSSRGTIVYAVVPKAYSATGHGPAHRSPPATAPP